MCPRFDDDEDIGNKKFTPFDKMSKKEKREFYAKARGDWNGVNPVTKVAEKRKKPYKGRRDFDED